MVSIDCTSDRLTRRDFVKKVGKATLAIGGGLTLETLVTVCAGGLKSITFKEEAPVIYPPLKGQKVQPPREGCYIGFHTGTYLKPFHEKIGKKCKIVVPYYFDMEIKSIKSAYMPVRSLAEKILAYGAIPFIYKMLDDNIFRHGKFKNLINNKEFREDIKIYARDIVKFGKPFFFCTMHELNGEWFRWGQQPSTAKWREMWQIFEDEANEYATWVWEFYAPLIACRNPHADSPVRYYPGDKYVDWIGISSFARSKYDCTYRSFRSKVSGVYHSMRVNHPDKPIMQSEFAATQNRSQSRWVKNAYGTIKSWPGMKAAVFWDNYNDETKDDHRLSQESMKTLKEVFKDPYFIGASAKNT